MSKRMLIDASHPEETRVVILSGNRVEEFDFETAARRPLKGNIFLAKVTRVEPSLQAAFIEYGGNRHGFLAFSEIHPDYYQIPVADRQALLAAQRADERSRERDDEPSNGAPDAAATDVVADAAVPPSDAEVLPPRPGEDDPLPMRAAFSEDSAELAHGCEPAPGPVDEAVQTQFDSPTAPQSLQEPSETISSGSFDAPGEDVADSDGADSAPDNSAAESNGEGGVEEIVVERVEAETISSGEDDSMDEADERRPASYNRMMRNYKIQEVIKKRQILLIQVVKEERGNKGAALTTYLSLAGRYCVLMPNSGRGGGISRKITNSADRRRLKDAAESLDVPEGMGLIVRTAGASRTKQEIQRDYEYLLRLWDSIRDLTLRSSAPALVYEEGNLIKRAIRDQFSRDIEEIVVEGQEGYDEALAFAKMLMPHQLEAVKQHDGRPPLFQKYKVESQLDSMFNPRVQLRSGGYIVINQTEALVAIDVNSGRSTREHNIEDTATKTNLEAAEEVARQLRLRDLAGLIVIDFIDMEENRNDRAVERRLKECLRHDRARIQIGRISPFGLMEMSRQRLRPGMVEGSTVSCPHCNGTGLIRSVESLALRALRNVEEEVQQSQPEGITVRLPTEVAVYIFNHKRADIVAMEERLNVSIFVEAKTDMFGADCEVEIGTPGTFRPRRVASTTAVSAETALSMMPEQDYYEESDEPAGESNIEEVEETADGAERAPGRERDDRGGRRGGRRRGRNRDGRERKPLPAGAEAATDPLPVIASEGEETVDEIEGDAPEAGAVEAGTETRDSTRDAGDRRRRRRGRRGGRRNGRPEGGFEAEGAEAGDGQAKSESDEEAAAQIGEQELAVASPQASQPTSSRNDRNEKKSSAAAAIARFFGFGTRPESEKDETAPEAVAAGYGIDPAPLAPAAPEVIVEPIAPPSAPEIAAPKAEEVPAEAFVAGHDPAPVQDEPEPAPAVETAALEPAPELPAAPPVAPAPVEPSPVEATPVAEPEPAPAEPVQAAPPEPEAPPAPPAPIVIPVVEKAEIVAIGEASGPPKGGWWKKREG